MLATITMRKKIILWMTLLFVGLFITQNVQTTYAIGDITVSMNGDELTTDVNKMSGNKGLENTWKIIFDKYKGVINGIAGLALFTVVLAFIINLVKLANAGTNANARQAALQGLLWTGLATVGLGAISTIVGIFYYMMQT